MLDLEAMKAARAGSDARRPFKTFISDEAYDRVMSAAAYVGCPAYRIVERLVVEGLPPVAEAEPNPKEQNRE